ncbi:MAG: hypothetical protein AAGG01_17350 [Planctomycetota bacterium]
MLFFPKASLLLILSIAAEGSPSPPTVVFQDEASVDVAEPAGSVPSDARLLELADVARGLVAGHYGETVEQLDTPVKIVSRHRLRIGLIKDLHAQCSVQVAPRHVNAMTKQLAESYSMALLARYAFADGEIQVCPENIERLGVVLEIPELTTEESLTAVLVHEFVHARDALQSELAKFVASATSADELQTRSAVLEGHAQWVTRKIVNGLEDGPGSLKSGFEHFTAAITAVPEGIEDPAQKLQASIAAQSFGFAYVDGERFVEAIAAARGPEGVQGLFTAPPNDPLVILQPDWHLDPSLRPESKVDATAGLDRFEEIAVPEDFAANRQTLMVGQLRASLAGLDEAMIEEFVTHLVKSELLIASIPTDPNQMLTVGLLEFDSAGGALAALRTQSALLEYRDSQFAGGGVRIESAEYTPWNPDAETRGMIAQKVVQAGSETIPVLTVVALRGALMIELSIIGEVDEEEAAKRWALETLEAATGAETANETR